MDVLDRENPVDVWLECGRRLHALDHESFAELLCLVCAWLQTREELANQVRRLENSCRNGNEMG